MKISFSYCVRMLRPGDVNVVQTRLYNETIHNFVRGIMMTDYISAKGEKRNKNDRYV